MIFDFSIFIIVFSFHSNVFIIEVEIFNYRYTRQLINHKIINCLFALLLFNSVIFKSDHLFTIRESFNEINKVTEIK